MPRPPGGAPLVHVDREPAAGKSEAQARQGARVIRIEMRFVVGSPDRLERQVRKGTMVGALMRNTLMQVFHYDLHIFRILNVHVRNLTVSLRKPSRGFLHRSFTSVQDWNDVAAACYPASTLGVRRMQGTDQCHLPILCIGFFKYAATRLPHMTRCLTTLPSRPCSSRP